MKAVSTDNINHPTTVTPPKGATHDQLVKKSKKYIKGPFKIVE